MFMVNKEYHTGKAVYQTHLYDSLCLVIVDGVNGTHIARPVCSVILIEDFELFQPRGVHHCHDRHTQVDTQCVAVDHSEETHDRQYQTA